jgi:hypothetical protein
MADKGSLHVVAALRRPAEADVEFLRLDRQGQHMLVAGAYGPLDVFDMPPSSPPTAPKPINVVPAAAQIVAAEFNGSGDVLYMLRDGKLLHLEGAGAGPTLLHDFGGNSSIGALSVDGRYAALGAGCSIARRVPG